MKGEIGMFSRRSSPFPHDWQAMKGLDWTKEPWHVIYGEAMKEGNQDEEIKA
jgi:hypothetical protein